MGLILTVKLYSGMWLTPPSSVNLLRNSWFKNKQKKKCQAPKQKCKSATFSGVFSKSMQNRQFASVTQIDSATYINWNGRTVLCDLSDCNTYQLLSHRYILFWYEEMHMHCYQMLSFIAWYPHCKGEGIHTFNVNKNLFHMIHLHYEKIHVSSF